MTAQNQVSHTRKVFFVIACITGLIHAYFTRNIVDSDGIQYLDIGNAVFSGDLKALINGWWNPLYPSVLGLVLFLWNPSSYWEPLVVHLTNFIIYLISFACFDFFLTQLLNYQKQKEITLQKSNPIRFPQELLQVLGYSLFIWTSINLVTISHVTPDMSVSAFVFLILGIILKINNGNRKWSIFIFLGLALGFGYLTKTAMFPMVFVFLTLSFFAISNIKLAIPRILISLVIFSLIASPYIISLSKSKGHFTFGESGRLNYPFGVDESKKPNYSYRVIFRNPKVYEFAKPFKVTYPPFYDLTYWCDPSVYYFDLKSHLKVILESTQCYFDLFVQMLGILITYFLALFFLSKRKFLIVKDLSKQWLLLIPAIIPLTAYFLILVEYRYLGPYVALFWIGLIASIKLPDLKEIKSFVSILTKVTVIFLIATSIFSKDMQENFLNKGAYIHWQVSEYLKEHGAQKGDNAAIIPAESQYYWARFAKLHIISEVAREDEDTFWTSSADTKSNIFKIWKELGIKMVIAYEPPSIAEKEGWIKIKNTPYFLYTL